MGGSTSQRLEAVVLAAGRSSRMGRPKPLLPLPEGGAVIERVVAQMAPHVGRVVVVVGHLGGQVAALAQRAGASIAINRDVDRGMLSSVQEGIAAVGDEASGALLCLGDQPELDGRTIGPVVAAAAGADLVIPTHDGHGGHPVYVARRFFAEILALPPDTAGGLRTVVRGHPEATIEIELPRPELLVDMDTPLDYQRTWRRLAAQQKETEGTHTHDR
ncbi:MAG: nucleotidyltransferase family protein [Gemmatimonadetes bacterium]|jgi:molybdenum cofactor cytidylyltransferase|nr:nucleotidyltransferase family protein [Gemmatimonadota bacterium]MBT6144910.1 nucleotidyltransferase family protein [Gemmatimonadota bacterium]MBT7861938.1 nucleotidyltransferase family protein [Gemmatimonadota bacterium]